MKEKISKWYGSSHKRQRKMTETLERRRKVFDEYVGTLRLPEGAALPITRPGSGKRG